MKQGNRSIDKEESKKEMPHALPFTPLPVFMKLFILISQCGTLSLYASPLWKPLPQKLFLEKKQGDLIICWQQSEKDLYEVQVATNPHFIKPRSYIRPEPFKYFRLSTGKKYFFRYRVLSSAEVPKGEFSKTLEVLARHQQPATARSELLECREEEKPEIIATPAPPKTLAPPSKAQPNDMAISDKQQTEETPPFDRFSVHVSAGAHWISFNQSIEGPGKISFDTIKLPSLALEFEYRLRKDWRLGLSGIQTPGSVNRRLKSSQTVENSYQWTQIAISTKKRFFSKLSEKYKIFLGIGFRSHQTPLFVLNQNFVEDAQLQFHQLENRYFDFHFEYIQDLTARWNFRLEQNLGWAIGNGRLDIGHSIQVREAMSYGGAVKLGYRIRNNLETGLSLRGGLINYSYSANVFGTDQSGKNSLLSSSVGGFISLVF